MASRLEKDIAARLYRQECAYPTGFPVDRNGIRLGLASIQDELNETLAEWNIEKRGEFNKAGSTYDELLDVIAVAIYVAKGFHTDA